MLCSVSSLDPRLNFPSLGIFLFYSDPRFESDASEPPLVRAARLMKKNSLHIDGMLLTKDKSNLYSVLRGCITLENRKYIFTEMGRSSSVKLHLSFNGESIQMHNKMVLEDAQELSQYPPLGLMLRWQNGELKAVRDRLQIGKFLKETPGKKYLDEWIAGITQLYAQPTYAVLAWLWKTVYGEKDTIGIRICGEKLKNLAQDLEKKGTFLAWFPDAKPESLAKWVKELNTITLNPGQVEYLNQHGSFAAGFYVAGIKGTEEEPRISFCDSVESDWAVRRKEESGCALGDSKRSPRTALFMLTGICF